MRTDGYRERNHELSQVRLLRHAEHGCGDCLLARRQELPEINGTTARVRATGRAVNTPGLFVSGAGIWQSRHCHWTLAVLLADSVYGRGRTGHFSISEDMGRGIHQCDGGLPPRRQQATVPRGPELGEG